MTYFELLITKSALIAGAGFFLWKVIAGWLVVNVEIAIETERQRDSETEDLLSFKLSFKKGGTDTLQIKDIQARVRTADEEAPPIKIFNFPEIHKLHSYKNKANWKIINREGKNISLSPDESFHLGRFVHIPAGIPVIVEAVLLGTRSLWGRGFQWRASVASMPVKKEK